MRTGEIESRTAGEPGIGARMLMPGETRIMQGEYAMLKVELDGGETYDGVSAIRLFPVTYPDMYVSLRQTDAAGKSHEIGVIDDVSAFDPEARELIRAALDRQHHERVISRIMRVRNRRELLFLDVETDRGAVEVIMKWQYDRAEDYGEKGKVLLDVNEDRFLIRDVSELPPADQQRLRRYIYW